MKLLILLGLLIVMTSNCFGQYDNDKLFYVLKSEKYRRMKNTGAILTIGGGILTVVGLSTLMNATVTTTSYGGGQTQTSTTGNPVGGAIVYLLGVAGLGSGIPLWIVGRHAERKYNRKFETISIRVNLNQQRTDLTLTCRL